MNLALTKETQDRTAQVALLFAVLHTIVYLPVYERLIQAWRTMPQCSHGWFVLPLAGWLALSKRKQLKDLRGEPSYAGLAATWAGLVLFVAASVYESDTGAYLSYMLTLAGIAISALGFGIFRGFIPLWLFLFFMFPIPDSLYLPLTGSLKLGASAAGAWVISAIGIPVLREGNIIQLSALQLNVVEACSGMQSLVSYLMLGSLLSFFLGGSIWRKGALVVAAVPVALFNNILRITGSGVLGEFFGREAVSGTAHEALGLLTFALGLGLLFGIFRLLLKSRGTVCPSH
jgi:exosortase